MRKSILFLMTLCLCIAMQAQEIVAQDIVLDNGLVRREIDCSNRHVTGKSFSLLVGKTQFIGEQSPEFSLRMDDAPYSGLSEWEHVSSRDTTDAHGGKGVILSLEQAEKRMKVELIYMLYPDFPVVHKTLRLTNQGTQDVKIEAVDVESLRLAWGPTDAWVMRQYARYKWLGPYTGNWDDPLVVVHNMYRDQGIAIGNGAVGVLKRTTAFMDGLNNSRTDASGAGKFVATMTGRELSEKGFPVTLEQKYDGELFEVIEKKQ